MRTVSHARIRSYLCAAEHTGQALARSSWSLATKRALLGVSHFTFLFSCSFQTSSRRLDGDRLDLPDLQCGTNRLVISPEHVVHRPECESCRLGIERPFDACIKIEDCKDEVRLVHALTSAPFCRSNQMMETNQKVKVSREIGCCCNCGTFCTKLERDRTSQVGFNRREGRSDCREG